MVKFEPLLVATLDASPAVPPPNKYPHFFRNCFSALYSRARRTHELPSKSFKLLPVSVESLKKQQAQLLFSNLLVKLCHLPKLRTKEVKSIVDPVARFGALVPTDGFFLIQSRFKNWNRRICPQYAKGTIEVAR